MEEKLRELGEQLKKRRLEMGITLQQVSEATKMRQGYLDAVEKGKHKAAPDPVYFRAFVKTYATFLGLDGTAFSKACAEVLNMERPPELPEPGERGSRSKARRSRRRKRNKVSPFLVILLVLAGLLFLFRDSITARFRPALNPPDEGNGEITGENKGPPEEPPDEEPLVITRVDPDGGTTVWESTQSPLSLVIKVGSGTDDHCWIRAEVDGEKTFEDTVSPGGILTLEGLEEIVVRAGKPWVMNLELNGNDLGIAGPYGPVKDLIVRYVP